MKKRNKRNNNGNKSTNATKTLVNNIYNAIMKNDDLLAMANDFMDNEVLHEAIEDIYGDVSVRIQDTYMDIVDDVSVVRGFSAKKFLPIIKMWVDQFKYRDGLIGQQIQDICFIFNENTNQDTIDAYAEISKICGNIVNSDHELDDDEEVNNEVTILSTILAVSKTLEYIKQIVDAKSYEAASDSAKDADDKDKKQESVEDEVIDTEVVEEPELNADNVNPEELKDSMDVESKAQDIYAEMEKDGVVGTVMMEAIMETIRRLNSKDVTAENIIEELAETVCDIIVDDKCDENTKNEIVAVGPVVDKPVDDSRNGRVECRDTSCSNRTTNTSQLTKESNKVDVVDLLTQPSTTTKATCHQARYSTSSILEKNKVLKGSSNTTASKLGDSIETLLNGLSERKFITVPC